MNAEIFDSGWEWPGRRKSGRALLGYHSTA